MSDEWRQAAERMLAEGFGVEDIAKRADCPVWAVRNHVNELRRSGRLVEILARQPEGIAEQ